MKPLTPLTKLKRKPKTLVQLFKDPRRWCKFTLYSQDKVSACVLGGMNYLHCGKASVFCDQFDPCREMQRRIAEAAGVCNTIWDLADWNNRDNLTHKQFLAVLKKAKV